MSNYSFWPIDMSQSAAITSDQSVVGSNDNKGLHHITQSSKAGTLPSDGLVVYPGHSLEGILLIYSNAVGVFSSPRRPGYNSKCY